MLQSWRPLQLLYSFSPSLNHQPLPLNKFKMSGRRIKISEVLLQKYIQHRSKRWEPLTCWDLPGFHGCHLASVSSPSSTAVPAGVDRTAGSLEPCLRLRLKHWWSEIATVHLQIFNFNFRRTLSKVLSIAVEWNHVEWTLARELRLCWSLKDWHAININKLFGTHAGANFPHRATVWEPSCMHLSKVWVSFPSFGDLLCLFHPVSKVFLCVIYCMLELLHGSAAIFFHILPDHTCGRVRHQSWIFMNILCGQKRHDMIAGGSGNSRLFGQCGLRRRALLRVLNLVGGSGADLKCCLNYVS